MHYFENVKTKYLRLKNAVHTHKVLFYEYRDLGFNLGKLYKICNLFLILLNFNWEPKPSSKL